MTRAEGDTMRRVYKYPLLLAAGRQEVQMPYGAIVRHVHEQDERPCLWAEIDTTAEMVTNTFGVFATGEDVPSDASFVGTIHVGWTVWHVYLLRDTDG